MAISLWQVIVVDNNEEKIADALYEILNKWNVFFYGLYNHLSI